MTKILVRYKLAEGRAAENEALIKAVFDELRANKPEGFRYMVHKFDDGVTFVHQVSIDTPDGSNPLANSPAFKEFQKDLKARCVEPPHPENLTFVETFSA